MSVLPHIIPFLLAIAQEGPILRRVDVCVYGDEKALVEFKGTWELLRQLPDTLQELIDDRRHLFRISIQVSIPAGTQLCLNYPSHYTLFESVFSPPTLKQTRSNNTSACKSAV